MNLESENHRGLDQPTTSRDSSVARCRIIAGCQQAVLNTTGINRASEVRARETIGRAEEAEAGGTDALVISHGAQTAADSDPDPAPVGPLTSHHTASRL